MNLLSEIGKGAYANWEMTSRKHGKAAYYSLPATSEKMMPELASHCLMWRTRVCDMKAIRRNVKNGNVK